MAEHYPGITGLPRIDYGQTYADYLRQHGSIGTWGELIREAESDNGEPLPLATQSGTIAIEAKKE